MLMKQYKVLNSNLDTLIQAQTGFDPTKPTVGNLSKEIENMELTLTKELNDSVNQLEKRLLDQQAKIQSTFEQKIQSAVAEVEKKMNELAEKVESSNSEVLKVLQDLRTETQSIQQSTKFEKQLDEAKAKIETAAQTALEISKFAEELQNTNAVLNQDMFTRLTNVLQPLINFADRLARPQVRPAPAQHVGHASKGGEALVTTSEATTTITTTTYVATSLGTPPVVVCSGPTFSTITTTTMGSSEAGGSTEKTVESSIAPHMEKVYKARREDYALMLKMNAFAHDDGKWIVEAIKTFRFQDLSVFNRLPLRSFDTTDSDDQQLDLPFNSKTFAFLQFIQ
ncbi:hypothetical protein L2E82_10125 [Cichorium intybus]|uniref:Uncharacterized protein n=1 Tax=Cichorium intybus TaxID=13427 RepID=A0ACB9G9U0_CICIN|nr:hypothetical protein L2E82_10125 [Cichorium intybus]